MFIVIVHDWCFLKVSLYCILCTMWLWLVLYCILCTMWLWLVLYPKGWFNLIGLMEIINIRNEWITLHYSTIPLLLNVEPYRIIHTLQFTTLSQYTGVSTKAFVGLHELGEEVHVVRLSMGNRHRQYQSHGWVHTLLTWGKFSTPTTLISEAF